MAAADVALERAAIAQIDSANLDLSAGDVEFLRGYFVQADTAPLLLSSNSVGLYYSSDLGTFVPKFILFY